MPATHPVSHSPRRALLLALAIVCGLVGLGLLIQSLRLGAYLSHADAAQHVANKRMADLNISLEAFRGDPESAKKTRPGFRQASAFLTQRTREIAATNAPWPAGEYKRRLLAATTASRAFANDVGTFADRVTTRAELLERLAKDVAAFEKSLRDAKTTAAGRAATRRLRGKLAATEKALHALPRSELAVYSDAGLLTGVGNLSNALSGMERGIASQNRDQLVISLLALKRTLESDWGKALLQPDSAGTVTYQRRAAAMRTLAEQAQAAQAAASRTRSSLAFYGALALLCAALSGLYALPRQSRA